jgi:hypothetical protein
MDSGNASPQPRVEAGSMTSRLRGRNGAAVVSSGVAVIYIVICRPVSAAGDEAGSRAQLAAFFTSLAIFFSSAEVSSFSAK